MRTSESAHDRPGSPIAMPTDAPIVTLWPFDRIGPGNELDQGLGKRFEQAGFDRAGKHRHELIAAQAADLAMVAHDRGQALGDLAEQCVADRVAERVVDVLEPVEIDQEQRAAFLPASGIAQRLVEGFAHQGAIGQAGQRIEAGKAADLLFRAALFGEVGADPAEAEEAAALVEDRIARQRPVNILVARRAHHHVGEWEAGRQVEAQGPLFAQIVAGAGADRQQIVKLPAQATLQAGI